MSAVHMGSWPVRLVRRIPVCAFRFASPDWPACGEQESAYVSVARPERTILAVTTVPQHDERFGRDRRLRSSRDFAHVRRSGRSVSGTLLAVGFARRATRAWSGTAQPATSARVGFTVGKRVGGAVTRNRVRRRLREAARRRLSGIAPEWDLVVIARPAAADATSETLAQELDTLLSRAKVLKIGGQEPTI